VPLNIAEQLFLDQARSDYEIYECMSKQNACHRLHYLQMCTEKLAKAYMWRRGVSPGLKHDKFEPFVRALALRRDFHEMFGYRDPRRFNLRKDSIFSLALRLQNLARGGGNNGPNPEYPWPPNMPTAGPLSYTFPEWLDWNETTAGRRLKYFVKNTMKDYETLFP
jgi:hypothetical protein